MVLFLSAVSLDEALAGAIKEFRRFLCKRSAFFEVPIRSVEMVNGGDDDG